MTQGVPVDLAATAEWERLKGQFDEWRTEDAAFERRDARLGRVALACFIGVVFLFGVLVGLGVAS